MSSAASAAARALGYGSRLLRPAGTQSPTLGPKSIAGLFSRDRSTARRDTRKRQRKGCSAASMPRASSEARRAGRRGGTRPISACWSTTWSPWRHRAVPAVHLARRYRFHLREDNAGPPAHQHGRHLGLIDDRRWETFSREARHGLPRARTLNSTSLPVGCLGREKRTALGQAHRARVHVHSLTSSPRRSTMRNW